MSEEYTITREFVFRLRVGPLETAIQRVQYGEFVSYIANVYTNGPATYTEYAVKSFGSLKRAERWAVGHLEKPTMLLLKYQGKVLYDV